MNTHTYMHIYGERQVNTTLGVNNFYSSWTTPGSVDKAVSQQCSGGNVLPRIKPKDLGHEA